MRRKNENLSYKTYRKFWQYRTLLPIVGNFFGNNNFSSIEVKDASALKTHYNNFYGHLCKIDSSYNENPVFINMFTTIDSDTGNIKHFKESYNINELFLDNKAYEYSEEIHNIFNNVKQAFSVISSRALEHNSVNTSNDSVLRLLYCCACICREIHSKYSDSYQSLEQIKTLSNSYHTFLYKVVRDAFDLEGDFNEFLLNLAESFKEISYRTQLAQEKINFIQLSEGLINNSKVIINRTISFIHTILYDGKPENKTSLLMNLYQKNYIYNDINVLENRLGYLLLNVANDYYVKKLFGQIKEEINFPDTYREIESLLELSTDNLMALTVFQEEKYDIGNIFTAENRKILSWLFSPESNSTQGKNRNEFDCDIAEDIGQVKSGIAPFILKVEVREELLDNLYNSLNNIIYFAAVNHHLDKAHKISGNVGQAFVYIVLKKHMTALLYSYSSTLTQLVSNLSDLLNKTSSITTACNKKMERKNNITAGILLFNEITEYQEEVVKIVGKIHEGIIKLNTPSAQKEIEENIQDFITEVTSFLSANEIHNNETLPKFTEFKNPIEDKRAEKKEDIRNFIDSFKAKNKSSSDEVPTSTKNNEGKQEEHTQNENEERKIINPVWSDINSKLGKLSLYTRNLQEGKKYFHLCLKAIYEKKALPEANILLGGEDDLVSKKFINSALGDILSIINKENNFTLKESLNRKIFELIDSQKQR